MLIFSSFCSFIIPCCVFVLNVLLMCSEGWLFCSLSNTILIIMGITKCYGGQQGYETTDGNIRNYCWKMMCVVISVGKIVFMMDINHSKCFHLSCMAGFTMLHFSDSLSIMNPNDHVFCCADIDHTCLAIRLLTPHGNYTIQNDCHLSLLDMIIARKTYFNMSLKYVNYTCILKHQTKNR